ncbi:MAG TPA: enoyl-CoA hydratase-related protein [Gemmatimonadota bacterium]|nr:enoyl-CoA hydratase-related protein [Gemmatimonadota bacterium]
MPEPDRLVRVERETPGVATVVLDRPDRRNALNAALVAELRRTLRELDADADVRVIALRGAGDDFCAGADLREVRESVKAGVLSSLDDAQALGDLFIEMREMRRPVVAIVRGRALAGGFGLATACDMVVAARSARFGYPEVRLGFVPAMVMAILRRSTGEQRAFELVAFGETIDAAAAAEYGLVNRVFDDDELDARAAEFLDELAGRSASAVALTKRLLYQIDGVGFAAAIRTGAEVNALARLTDDCRAGIDRFLDRKDRSG